MLTKSYKRTHKQTNKQKNKQTHKHKDTYLKLVATIEIKSLVKKKTYLGKKW